MTPYELRLACEERIQQWERDNWAAAEYPHIYLTLPWLATGENTRLAKTKGPMSEFIANVVAGRGTTAAFDARKVLAYLERHAAPPPPSAPHGL
ncbi:hypothetical protein [Tautonia marina]|uniref:hypothetical protein n=1 Tax=Tautonia marina TaxID=2653855 RepID=UPI001260769D|nr:hypothetical protein [Tautonia marina]